MVICALLSLSKINYDQSISKDYEMNFVLECRQLFALVEYWAKNDVRFEESA